MLLQPTLMSGYEGLLSLSHLADSDILPDLIRLHHAKINPKILDCTYGEGTMWTNCDYQPDVKTDLRPLPWLDSQADFGSLPFRDGSFDVIVFDPPHIPIYVGDRCNRFYARRYGIDVGVSGDNVIPLFATFLAEADRMLADKGIVLAKLCDIIHHHKYQWQQVAFVVACHTVGLTACDMLIKESSCGNLISSKWQNQYHLRRTHSYWIVARKGGCER